MSFSVQHGAANCCSDCLFLAPLGRPDSSDLGDTRDRTAGSEVGPVSVHAVRDMQHHAALPIVLRSPSVRACAPKTSSVEHFVVHAMYFCFQMLAMYM